MASPLPILKHEETRTLAHVLLDIAETERENNKATLRFYSADAAGDQAEAERQADIGATLDDRLSDLRDEARAMIEAATGVTWDQISEANL